MAKLLYVYKSGYPWDVRADKICKSMSNNGFETYLAARWFPGQSLHDEYNGYKIIRTCYRIPLRLSAPFPGNPLWKKSLRSIVSEVKPDLIIHRDIIISEASISAASKFNIPIIMDMAENYPAAMRIWKKYRQNPFYRVAVHGLSIPEKIERRNIPRLSGIITVCSEQSHRLNNRYGFPTEKMCVVHNTPDLSLLANVKKGCRQESLTFGHHGYLSSEKNMDILLKGFILAAEKCGDIFCRISGSGECLPGLKKIAKSSDLGSRIFFSGSYKYDELPDILSQVDIGVIPYTPNDFNNFTIHNKIFDFFAAGKPVLVSESAPLVRLVKETNAGIIADCSEPSAIAEAILSIKKYDLEQLSRNALKTAAEKYNWMQDEKTLLDFINSFI